MLSERPLTFSILRSRYTFNPPIDEQFADGWVQFSLKSSRCIKKMHYQGNRNATSLEN